MKIINFYKKNFFDIYIGLNLNFYVKYVSQGEGRWEEPSINVMHRILKI